MHSRLLVIARSWAFYLRTVALRCATLVLALSWLLHDSYGRRVACAIRSRDALHLKVAWLHHTYIHMCKKKTNNFNTHEGVGARSFVPLTSCYAPDSEYEILDHTGRT